MSYHDKMLVPLGSSKRLREDASGSSQSNSDKKKRRKKSRFEMDENEKTIIPGMPTCLPSNSFTPEQEKAYVLQIQIEDISRRLRTGNLGIPENPRDRSPSPEPIYNHNGTRINTREVLKKRKLEEERHELVQKMFEVNPSYRPPSDYKPITQKICERVHIPQEEYPEVNFIGLLIGPRGNTLKDMEAKTETKIMIRGKGSVREDRMASKAHLPGNDEPLHAFVTGTNMDNVNKAIAKINHIIKQSIECPDDQNEFRRNQLRQLAIINGTLVEGQTVKCSNCGSFSHKSWECPDKPNLTNTIICHICNGAGHIARDCRQRGKPNETPADSNLDEEYMSLMSELGEVPEHAPKKISKYTSNASSITSSGSFLALPPSETPNDNSSMADHASPLLNHSSNNSAPIRPPQQPPLGGNPGSFITYPQFNSPWPQQPGFDFTPNQGGANNMANPRGTTMSYPGVNTPQINPSASYGITPSPRLPMSQGYSSMSYPNYGAPQGNVLEPPPPGVQRPDNSSTPTYPTISYPGFSPSQAPPPPPTIPPPPPPGNGSWRGIGMPPPPPTGLYPSSMQQPYSAMAPPPPRNREGQ